MKMWRMTQMMSNLVDEIQRLTDKLTDYKQLYYIQLKEREMAGQRYTEINDELDKNKQVINALHVMQTRYSDENSVSPSVCPSVRHTREL